MADNANDFAALGFKPDSPKHDNFAALGFKPESAPAPASKDLAALGFKPETASKTDRPSAPPQPSTPFSKSGPGWLSGVRQEAREYADENPTTGVTGLLVHEAGRGFDALTNAAGEFASKVVQHSIEHPDQHGIGASLESVLPEDMRKTAEKGREHTAQMTGAVAGSMTKLAIGSVPWLLGGEAFEGILHAAELPEMLHSAIAVTTGLGLGAYQAYQTWEGLRQANEVRQKFGANSPQFVEASVDAAANSVFFLAAVHGYYSVGRDIHRAVKESKEQQDAASDPGNILMSAFEDQAQKTFKKSWNDLDHAQKRQVASYVHADLLDIFHRLPEDTKKRISGVMDQTLRAQGVSIFSPEEMEAHYRDLTHAPVTPEQVKQATDEAYRDEVNRWVADYEKHGEFTVQHADGTKSVIRGVKPEVYARAGGERVRADLEQQATQRLNDERKPAEKAKESPHEVAKRTRREAQADLDRDLAKWKEQYEANDEFEYTSPDGKVSVISGIDPEKWMKEVEPELRKHYGSIRFNQHYSEPLLTAEHFTRDQYRAAKDLARAKGGDVTVSDIRKHVGEKTGNQISVAQANAIRRRLGREGIVQVSYEGNRLGDRMTQVQRDEKARQALQGVRKNEAREPGTETAPENIPLVGEPMTEEERDAQKTPLLTPPPARTSLIATPAEEPARGQKVGLQPISPEPMPVELGPDQKFSGEELAAAEAFADQRDGVVTADDIRKHLQELHGNEFGAVPDARAKAILHRLMWDGMAYGTSADWDEIERDVRAAQAAKGKRVEMDRKLKEIERRIQMQKERLKNRPKPEAAPSEPSGGAPNLIIPPSRLDHGETTSVSGPEAPSTSRPSLPNSPTSPEDVLRAAGLTPKGRTSSPKTGNLVWFNDPETGSTLTLPVENVTSESIQAKLEESRAKFAAAKQPEAKGTAEEPTLAPPPTPKSAKENPGTEAPQPPIKTGEPTTVKTPDGDYAAHYAVIDLADLVPSHNPFHFRWTPGYPRDAQPRDYENSENQQNKVIQNADHFDASFLVNSNPDAVNGPTVVAWYAPLKKWIALGGNGRLMSLSRVFKEDRGAEYTDSLRKHIRQFGLDESELSGKQHPVLVRLLDRVPTEHDMVRLGKDLNRTFMSSMDMFERAMSVARSLDPETLHKITSLVLQVGPDASLRDAMRAHPLEFLKALEDVGLISKEERPQFIDPRDGTINDAGKDFLESALVATILDDVKTLKEAPKSTLNKIGSALTPLSEIRATDSAWNITPVVREAVRDFTRMISAGENVATWIDHPNMFGPPRNPLVDAMMRELNKGPRKVNEDFDKFVAHMRNEQNGQGNFLAPGGIPPWEAFNDAFGANITEDQYVNGIESILKDEESHDEGRDGKQATGDRAPQPPPARAKRTAASGGEEDTGNRAAPAKDEGLTAPPQARGPFLGLVEKIAAFPGVTREQANGVAAVLEANARYLGVDRDAYVSSNIADFEDKSGTKNGAKGQTEFLEDGRAIIRAFKRADVSTLAHESAHVFRRLMKPEDEAVARQVFGAEGGWDVAAEERFARAFERYLKDGKTSRPELRPVFANFKQWLSDIYGRLKGTAVPKIPDGARELFDRILGENSENEPPRRGPDDISAPPESRRNPLPPESRNDESEGPKPPPRRRLLTGSTPIDAELNKALGLLRKNGASFQLTEAGNIGLGADAKSLGKVLGSSLYSGKSGSVILREMIQNAADAIRGVEGGKVHVFVDASQWEQRKYGISVTDNGRGMSPEEVATVFTDLGSSGKRDNAEASGGFGLAKAAILLGGERMSLSTVHEGPGGTKTRTSMAGTPEDFLDGRVSLKTENAGNAPTGTHIEVKLKQGDTPSVADIENLYASSPSFPGSFTYSMKSFENGNEMPGNVYRPVYTEVHREETPDYELSIMAGDNPFGRSSIYFSNNGVGQWSRYLSNPDEEATGPILVDIRPKTSEGSSGYPFTANRESLREDVEKKINGIVATKITDLAIANMERRNRMQWEAMPSFDAAGKKIYLYGMGREVTAEDAARLSSDPDVVALANSIADVVHQVADASGTADKVSRVGLLFSGDAYGVSVPAPSGEGGKVHEFGIFVNPFEHIKKDKTDLSGAIFHTIVHEVAHNKLRGHDAGFAGEMARVYEAMSRRRKIDLADNIYSTLEKIYGSEEPQGGWSHEASPVASRLLRQYAEIAGRKDQGSAKFQGGAEHGAGSSDEVSEREDARGRPEGLLLGGAGHREDSGGLTPPPRPRFGDRNRLVNREGAEHARQNVRSHLTRLNSGLDPELVASLIKIGAYYLEGGLYDFKDWAAMMVDKIGKPIIPVLKDFYEHSRAQVLGGLYELVDDGSLSPGDLAYAKGSIRSLREVRVPTADQARKVQEEQTRRVEQKSANRPNGGNDAERNNETLHAPPGRQNGAGGGGHSERGAGPGGDRDDHATTPGRRPAVAPRSGGRGGESERGDSSPANPLGKVKRLRLAEPERPAAPPVYDEGDWRKRMQELEMPEMVPAPTVKLSTPTRAMLQKFPGQAEMVEVAVSGLNQHDAFVLGSSTGTGKSFLTAAVIAELGKSHTLVLTGNTGLVSDYIDVATRFGLDARRLEPGRGIPEEPGVYVATYAAMRNRPGFEDDRWGLVVADESDMGRRTQQSQTADMLLRLTSNADKALFSSATPLHTASDTRMLDKLGLWRDEGFDSWAMQQLGARYDATGTLVIPPNPRRMSVLRDQLIERGQFINRDRSMEGYNGNFAVVPLTPAQREGLKNIERAMDMVERYYDSQGKRAMVRAARAYKSFLSKAFLERARLPQIITLARKAVDQGWQPLIFVETRSEVENLPDFVAEADARTGGMIDQLVPSLPNVVTELQKAFGGSLANFSGPSSVARAQELRDFNAGKKKVLFLTYAAGGRGVSAHDTSELGQRPRMAFHLGLPWSGGLFEQAVGRPWRYGTTSDVDAYFLVSDAAPEIRLVTQKVAPRLEELRASVSGINPNDPLVKQMRSHRDATLAYANGDGTDKADTDFTTTVKTDGLMHHSQIKIRDASEAKGPGRGMRIAGGFREVAASVLNQMDSGERNPVPRSVRQDNETRSQKFVQSVSGKIDSQAAKGMATATALAIEDENHATQEAAAGAAAFHWSLLHKLTESVQVSDAGLALRDLNLKYFTNGLSGLKNQYGEPGGRIERTLRVYMAESRVILGPWQNEAAHILQDNKLAPDEWANMVDVIEGKGKPANERVAKAAGQMRNLIHRVFEKHAEVGTQLEYRSPDGSVSRSIPYSEMSERPNYYPHVIDPQAEVKIGTGNNQVTVKVEDLLRRVRQNRTDAYRMSRQQIVKSLMANYGMSEYEAEHFLGGRGRLVPLAGNIERARTANHPFYRKDYAGFIQYLEESAEAAARAKVLGQYRQVLDGMIAEIPDHANKDYLNQILEATLAPQHADQADTALVRFAGNWSVLSKMGLNSTLKVLLHPVLTTLVTDTGSYMRSMFEGVRNFEEMKERATIAGSISAAADAAMINEFAGRGAGDRWLRMHMFQKAYDRGRVIADGAARTWLTRKALPALLKNPDDAFIRRTLHDEFLMSPQEIDQAIKDRQFPEKAVNRGAVAITDRTMFNFSPATLPPGWREAKRGWGGEFVRQATLLKGFEFRVAALLKARLIDEARKGNFRPWLPVLTLLPLAGEVIQQAMGLTSVALHAPAHFVKGTPLNDDRLRQLQAAIKGGPDAWLERYAEDFAVVTGASVARNLLEAMTHRNRAIHLAEDLTEEFVGILGADAMRTLQLFAEETTSKSSEERMKLLQNYLRETYPESRILISKPPALRRAHAYRPSPYEQ